MAEGRMLKRKISLNEALADLANDSHRLLFTWGIAHLDVEGRITGSPRGFKALVAPLLDHINFDTVTPDYSPTPQQPLSEASASPQPEVKGREGKESKEKASASVTGELDDASSDEKSPPKFKVAELMNLWNELGSWIKSIKSPGLPTTRSVLFMIWIDEETG
jgi:hypothetical protein